jgi:HlyD family secretion protein
MTTATAPPSKPETHTRRGTDPAEVRRALSSVEGHRRWIGRLIVLLLIVGAAAFAWRWRKMHPTPKPPRFLTDEVSRGEVVETVQSTGTVQPVTQVQVGAQVSGRIKKRYVDFNSKVKKGDLLVELDPTIYEGNVARDRAQITNAQADIEGAKAALSLALANYDRAKLLKKEGLLGEADLLTAKGGFESATARLHQAQAGLTTASAALKNSQTNLSYTKIYAPIDGVVVSRSIDEGQTVAASFQAPVLFTIAQDLREMNVLADIDEADLGRLSGAKNPEVEVAVSAFPGEIFPGTLKDVRFNATVTQGVVTYPAVIEVRNPDLKLRPGMTATVSIRTVVVKDALRVPNAALRYRPLPPMGPDGKPKPVKPEAPLPKGKGRVFFPPPTREGDAIVQLVDVGVTDGQYTVVLSPLDLGTKLVVDEVDESDEKKKQKSPF